MGEIAVYKITNTSNQKIYIGSAVNFTKRKMKHLTALRGGYHHNTHLQRAFNKYGENHFQFRILELLDSEDELLSCEQTWMDSEKPEYNICPTAGSPLGRKQSEETRKKIGEAHKGKVFSEESREKVSKANKGRKVPEEYKKILRKKMIGNKYAEGNKNRRKFNDDQIKEILSIHAQGAGCRRLAKKYNVVKKTIQNIINNRGYKNGTN